MKHALRIICLGLLIGNAVPAAEAQARKSETENALFNYTHLLPSPLTLKAGRFILGTGVAIGITDSLEIGTNLAADLVPVYNASAKLSLFRSGSLAFALTGGWQHYQLRTFDSSAPDTSVTTWLPGAVAGVSLADPLAWFVGGTYNITSQTVSTEGGVPVSGYFQGASVETDLSWAYWQPQRGLPNVLSAGVSYDFTYKLAGFGLSHVYKGFKLGLHYYPAATSNKILPIIAGGMAIDL